MDLTATAERPAAVPPAPQTPDPARWAVEAWAVEKRFVRREGVPMDTTLGAGHWIVSNVLKYRTPPVVQRAVDGVDLRVARGELLGLLGPNGAGKTTLLKCLATLLELDGGEAFVDGYSVRTHPDHVRLSINLVGSGHWVAFDWALTVTENLHFFGSLYGWDRAERQRRIDESLERLRLAHLANATPRTLSAGERQRLLLAKGFMIRAPVFFLDEPTVALDPGGARSVREFIRRELIGRSRTAGILTTHRMDEAEALCGRLAIMDRGRVVACGTPDDLKRLTGHRSVLEIRTAGITDAALRALRRVSGVLAAVAAPLGGESIEESVRVHTEGADAVAGAVADALRRERVPVLSVEAETPTLEDAFIALTDRTLR